MNHTSKRLATFGVSAIGALGLLVLPGCGATPGSEDSGGEFRLETAEEAKVREQSAAGQPSALDPGVPGEAMEEELASGVESSAAANCVYIQWCNEPGDWGSVCRVRSSCLNQCNTAAGREAMRQECVRDANYVCGTIVRPEIARGCP